MEYAPFEANRDVRTMHSTIFDSKLGISKQMLLDHSVDAEYAYQCYINTANTYKILKEKQRHWLVKKLLGERWE